MALSHSEANALVSRLRSQVANKRAKESRMEHVLVRKSGVALTSVGLGALRKHGVSPGVKGLPWKPLAWLGLTMVEAFGKGVVQSFAAGASDATMAVYLENAIASGSMVAGEGGEI